MSQENVNRRDFLKTGAATAAALSLAASSYAKIKGANEKLRVAYLGTGGRSNWAHISIGLDLVQAGRIQQVGVCDVWDGNLLTDTYGRGLYPTAKRCGLNAEDSKSVTKDYRRLLDRPDVDIVCIAAPDHWHAKMSIDAADAGKAVYCEKPMTKTIEESQAVVDTMQKKNKVMTVGVQSTADPTWRAAHKYITDGKIGHVVQAQTSYYRNSDIGQWRYYKLTKDMTPKTVDWDMFLGHDYSIKGLGQPLGPKIPFDRAVYAQWRCYWPFGGGMFTDLFVHQTTHMITAMGVRYPRRVVGGGGIYVEYDTRDVPDVATIVADYDEGCQLMITATMVAAYPIEEVIRGHLAAIKFVNGGFEVIDDPVKKKAGPALPARLERSVRGKYHAHPLPPVKGAVHSHEHDTRLLWDNFLDCVQSGNRDTLSPPELGAAAFTTVMLGVQSYRQGKALFWDKENRKATDADASWAANWEKRSKERGKPNQVMGWHADDTGSLLHPPAYQKLEGPWIDGKDPAAS
jgi:predicted dehydrogenase